MSLNQFEKEFHIGKRQLNVVVCVYHSLGVYKKNLVNQMLEYLQEQLKRECDEYEKVQIDYIYETPSLQIKKIERLEKDTPIQYQEPCKSSETHSITHMVFMGLAVLEQKLYECDIEVENRMYLITDERFKRVQVKQLIMEKNGEFFLHPRFSKIEFTPVLIKTENAGGDWLEEYIRNHSNGQVFILKSGKIISEI